MPETRADDVELRHGYTVAQVRSLSLALVRRQTWLESVSFDQRLEVAWHAIIEHIYTSDQPPGTGEVIQAASRAVNRDVQQTRQFLGRNTKDRYAAGATIRGFERYWWFAAKSTPGPENGVTERVALTQIWPRLHPGHQAVLAALATHGDNGRAAAALGISGRLFTHRLSDARQAFLRMWHEGEAPSRVWCTSKATAARRRRTRRAAGSGQPPRRFTPGRARADLGITDAELVRRYHAGESIRQLAASLGTYYSAVQTRLHAEGAQLRPAAGTSRAVIGKPEITP